MVRKTYLGIDAGTTVLKAALWDASKGKPVAWAARPILTRTLPRGGREQRVANLQYALLDVLASLRESAPDDYAAIAGIGLGSQGGSVGVQSREKYHGTNIALWNDARSRPYVERLKAEDPSHWWCAMTLRDVPPNGLGHVLRLREEEPEAFADDFIVTGVGDYLFHLITGVWRQDPGHAIQVGSYDAARKELTGELLARVGLTADGVPPLRRGHETAPSNYYLAELAQIPEGVPVAGPYIDQEAGYLAALGASDRPLQCSLGTAWVANFELPKGVLGRSPFQLTLPALHEGDHLVVQPMLSGNTAWDWALRCFCGPDPAQRLDNAARRLNKHPRPMDGLVAVPWLLQANPFAPEENGALSFLGVGPGVDEGSLLQAVAAGLCYELGRVMQDVHAAGCLDAVVLYGGASKGLFFRKLLATLFAPLPVYAPDIGDLAVTRGALHAFGLAQKTPKGRQAAPFKGEDAAALLRGFETYLNVYDTLYGHVAHAAPYTFEENV